MGDTLLPLKGKTVVSPDHDEEALPDMTGLSPFLRAWLPLSRKTRDERRGTIPVVHRSKLVPTRFLEGLLQRLEELRQCCGVTLFQDVTHKRTLHIVGRKGTVLLCLEEVRGVIRDWQQEELALTLPGS